MVTNLRFKNGWICGIVLTLCNINWVDSFAIDNEVIGVPQVQCSEDAVTFAVRTRNPFTGNIYIKGKFNEPACRQEFFSNTFNGASYTVRIPLCGMRRIRQLQPQGMNYILVFVVNFHPQFNTKIDRAYNVRCFYAQQEKTVTSQLEISMMSTQVLEAATMLMPNCEYSIRSGSLNGPRVRYVRVGDRLVHRWECDNPNFGMLIKNCFVNDGSGSSVRVLDSRGCPVFTPVIQGPLQYDNSLNLAYVEVWAYKFPDRQDLYFQCQVQVCNKRENECVGVTPPNCPLAPHPAFTPSSVVEPGVTGPFGPVTYVRGTFERPFPGQELVVGPYGPGAVGQQVLPQPAPYGPPFGQQVLPGYVPGGQPVVSGQQVPSAGAGGGYPVAVGFPGGAQYPGVASDQGPNARGSPAAAEGGQPKEDERGTNQPHSNTGQRTGQPQTEDGRGQPQRVFNTDVRNDDSDKRHSSNNTVSLNSTFAPPPPFAGNNGTRRDPRLRRQQARSRKTRREAEMEDENEFDTDSGGIDSQLYTNPGPTEHSDADTSGTMRANSTPQGDGHLMDVTADVVYVADVGDVDGGEDLKRYPFTTVTSGETKQVCMNPLAFGLLFASFAILVVIIALLLLYLLTRSGRWPLAGRRRGAEPGDDPKWPGADSSTSSTVSRGKMNSVASTPAADPDDSNGEKWLAVTNDKHKYSPIGALRSMFSFRLPSFNLKRLPM